MTTAASHRSEPTAFARVAHRVVLLALVLSQLVQLPGRTTFDTKFDLTVDPTRLLEGSLHLWNPLLSFGELQNQAYGYLFPMGPFFALGDLVDVPPWLVQRLWSALILVAAFEGARRLHRALAPAAGPWLWLVSGLAYALAPRMVGLIGVLSSEALPAAVLPWVALPIVHAVAGRYSPAVAAGLSGSAFLLVGGVNATAAVAILPLPAMLIICGRGVHSRVRLAAWWTAAVLAASAWWILPLLVLGRYSPPFLDVIESARATTASMGWSNVARGLDHWVFFTAVDGRPWWTAGYALATSPALVGVTALVAAASFAGLMHPKMPGRLPLAVSALVGVVLMGIGHGWALASPADDLVRSLLDGPLAPLRNVHKLDPVVRLPLALGLGHLIGAIWAAARTGPEQRILRRRRKTLARGAAAVAVVALIVSAWPLVTGTLRQDGWREVPAEWRQAAVYLGEHSDAGRTWVLPGSGFGRQTWGRTVDEPLQPLARAAWVTRSQVPLVPQQTMRHLDALEARVSSGRGSPALAQALARSGIGHVLLRHDSDARATTSPPAQRVAAALQQSGGLTLVKSFDEGVAPIDIYRVEPYVETVDITDTKEVTRVTGGPEDVLSLLEGGVLPPDRPSFLVPTDAEDVDAIGDGYQLRERQFGRTLDAVGPLLAPEEPYRLTRPVHDYAGAEGVEHVTATSPSRARVSASSSSGYPDTVGPVRPEYGPAAVVDRSDETFWRSAPLADTRGQWVEIALPSPRAVEHVDVTAGVDGLSGLPVRRIRVTAGDQSIDQDVDPLSGFARVRLSGAPVSTVRVTVTAMGAGSTSGVVALREVTVPGLDATQEAKVPGAGVHPATDLRFRADPGRRACTKVAGRVRCDAELATAGDESTGLRRVFTTAEVGTWSLAGTVVATASPATLALLDPLGESATVRASSTLANDPLVAPAFAHDADPSTWWSSALGDRSPSITMSWGAPRLVSGVRVQLAPTMTRVPRTAVVAGGGLEQEVAVDENRMVRLSPFQATELTITFPSGDDSSRTDPRPLGISEVELDGLQGLTYQPDRASPSGALCGMGPRVVIDDNTVETEIRGTLGDVLDGTELRIYPCAASGPLRTGDHRLAAVSTDRFAVTSLTMAADTPPEPAVGTRSFAVQEWGQGSRAVTVGPGSEAVLRVTENANVGWQATLEGQVLEPVVLDGWQQGYRVPAGEGGRIDLQFEPDRPYRAGLAAGAISALLLVISTLIGMRRTAGVPTTSPGRADWMTLEDGTGVRAALIVTAVVAGGPPLAGGALAGAILRTRPLARLAIGATCIAGGGVLSALSLVTGVGPSSGLADLVAGVGLGLMVAALPSPAYTIDSEEVRPWSLIPQRYLP